MPGRRSYEADAKSFSTSRGSGTTYANEVRFNRDFNLCNLTPKRNPGDNPIPVCGLGDPSDFGYFAGCCTLFNWPDVFMKLAILGTDEAIVELAAAALREHHEFAWLGDVRSEDRAAIAGYVAALCDRASEWELLVDRAVADA